MTTHTPEVQALSRLYLFKQVPIDTIAELVQQSQVLTFQTGQRIFHVGDPSDTALLVISGRLAVVLPESQGEYKLGDVRPGEVTGETALLSNNSHRGATLLAQEDTTCLEISPELMMVAAENPALIALEQHMMGTMARRIRELNTNIQKATRVAEPPEGSAAHVPSSGLMARLRAFLRGE